MRLLSSSIALYLAPLVAIYVRTVSSFTTKLDTICLLPLFGSDLHHALHCSGDHHHPRYRPSPFREPESGWTAVGPCFQPLPGDRAGRQDVDSELENLREFCIYYNDAFANGRGVAVLTDAPRAAHIAASPAFRDPRTLDGANILTWKAKLATVAHKGLGLVATDTIFRGEPIIHETASFLIDYSALAEIPKMDLFRLQSAGLDYFPEAHRARVLNMSAHGVQLDYINRLEMVFFTNAFDVVLEDEDGTALYSLFPENARMNHDCRPNVDFSFDPKTMMQHATALRDIFPGEELTVSYISVLDKQSKRKSHLRKQWGFRCSCSACNASPAQIIASDQRLTKITELQADLRDLSLPSSIGPEHAELLISLIEQERVHTHLSEAYKLAALHYNAVGDDVAAVRFAYKAADAAVSILHRYDDVDAVDMRSLIYDPTRHWSWMRKAKDVKARSYR